MLLYNIPEHVVLIGIKAHIKIHHKLLLGEHRKVPLKIEGANLKADIQKGKNDAEAKRRVTGQKIYKNM